jgi:hypothetical protein
VRGSSLFVAVLLLLAPLCSRAQFELSADEQRLVAWVRSVDPALAYLQELRVMLEIEAEIQLELPGICGKERFTDDADRLADPVYGEIVRAALVRWRAERPKPDRATLDPLNLDEQVAVYSYRQADAAARRAWLVFIERPDSRAGRDALRKIEEAVYFRGRNSADAVAAERHVTWLHWLDEYLRRAGLRDAFLGVLEERQPGVRADFLDFVATTPASRSEQFERLDRRFETLGDADATNLVAQLTRLSTPAVAGAIREWSAHPMVVRVKNNEREMLEIWGSRDYGKDPDLGSFVREMLSELGSDRSASAVAQAVVKENCKRFP